MLMSDANPGDAVDAIIADVLAIDEGSFSDDDVFGTDLRTESLDYVEIAETIEFELGVAVPDEELERIETVDHLKTYVVNHT
ncbi:MAG: acyl carrier protein [Salinirussus sp.]|jgi:acyl carrier protein